MISLLIAVPVVACIAILLAPKEGKQAYQTIATIATAVGLALSIGAWIGFTPGPNGFDYVEAYSWIPGWSVQFKVGVDGMSLLLIVLTHLLSLVSVLSSFTYITKRDREYYFFLLLLHAGVIGTFAALDLFLFYVFWEVMLVPLYFLIGIWGSQDRVYAAVKFFLFTLTGSVLMLIGILWLYFHTGTFDITEIGAVLAERPLSQTAERWMFAAMFLAFAIKVPMWPLHTWLPDAHTEAPTAGSVILAGVLLKTGVYGILRFCIPYFPGAAHFFQPYILVLSVIAIVYGACVVIGLIVGPAEKADVKRMIAYSSVSHMGYVTLGIFAFTAQGLQGGILQMINHGLSTGALFLLIGILYERRHTRLMGEYGGLSQPMPVYATLFMIAMLSSIGLPLLNGFVGEFLILLGAFQVSITLVTIAATGVILGAIYMLWIYQRVFFGPVTHDANQNLRDCTPRELATLLPLLAICLWIGLYPAPFLRLLEPVSQSVMVSLEQPWESDLFAVETDHDAGGHNKDSHDDHAPSDPH